MYKISFSEENIKTKFEEQYKEEAKKGLFEDMIYIPFLVLLLPIYLILFLISIPGNLYELYFKNRTAFYLILFLIFFVFLIIFNSSGSVSWEYLKWWYIEYLTKV